MSLTKIILSISLLCSFSLFASDKVVYGPDDRLDLFETASPLYLELAKSTAAQIPNSSITNRFNGTHKIRGKSLESRGVCSGEKFSKQPTAARCSGFLVGPNLLVTAGHCIENMRDCRGNKWVFDYAYEERNTDVSTVASSSVYSCKRIIERSLNGSTMNDYALIELDKVVTDRPALKYRTSGKVAVGERLVVIGHPTGLPTKIADNAIVRENSRTTYFQSNLDTFGGNSGSAVFNTATGEVEGILVRGEVDYKYDGSRGCKIPKTCTDDGCRGEDVTRITNIKAL